MESDCGRISDILLPTLDLGRPLPKPQSTAGPDTAHLTQLVWTRGTTTPGEVLASRQTNFQRSLTSQQDTPRFSTCVTLLSTGNSMSKTDSDGR